MSNNLRMILLLSSVLISIMSYAQENPKTPEEVNLELEDMKVQEIQTACDCSDAMAKLANVLLRETERFSSQEEVFRDPVGKQIVNLVSIKIGEVAKRCEDELGFNDADIIDCESFIELKEKSELLNRKFRR